MSYGAVTTWPCLVLLHQFLEGFRSWEILFYPSVKAYKALRPND